MTIIKELSVVKTTYTNKQGEEKKVWLNVGQVHEHEGREYITLDPTINFGALPRKQGDDRLFVSMFEPKPKDQQAKPQGKQQDDDSLPF